MRKATLIGTDHQRLSVDNLWRIQEFLLFMGSGRVRIMVLAAAAPSLKDILGVEGFGADALWLRVQFASVVCGFE